MKTADHPISVPVVCGPTASGKTALAVDLFGGGGSIAVSADSVQIYRGMDIGSAKASPEEREKLPHRLIDIRNPDETYSAGNFFKDAVRETGKIIQQGKVPLILGGTGLYLKTLICGFFDGPPADPEIRQELKSIEDKNPGRLHELLRTKDPGSASRLSPNDTRRIIRALEVFSITGTPISVLQREQTEQAPYRFRIAGIIHDRRILEERIHLRIDRMFSVGLIGEVENLRERGYTDRLPSMQSLGYRHVFEYLCSRTDLSSCRESLKKDTVAFARRQILLFKKIPGMTWFNGDDSAGISRYFREYTG